MKLVRVGIIITAFWICPSGSPAVAAEVPRPEYPQPQFMREQWMTLNGSWEFEFDDANVGLDENWARSGKKFSRTILVPFAFETPRSGIGDRSFHPWVWYRRTFTVPGNWKGRRVLLHFGAVDYRATVWVNGHLAGTHEGGSTPFRFDITPLLTGGSNTLVVRAEDPPTDRYISRGKQYWEPKSRGIFYTRTTGIWQSVWLEAVGESYLEGVRITPSLEGLVHFEGRVALSRGDLTLSIAIRFGDQPVVSGTAQVDGPKVTAALKVESPRLWSPWNPNLYDVTFELRRGQEVLDRVQSYFGVRTITAENGRVLLNKSPIYLKTVLDQGYWPESNLTPPSDEAIQYDIRMTKEMGFNGARKHQKLEDPRFLYWADKMGLLVSSEMANAYLYDAAYVSRFTREWMEAMERDYNHPSIIIWVPINESWGTPDLRNPQQQAHLKSLYWLTRSLDSTRLVIDNDGWEHVDTTDLFAIHDYARTGDILYQKYKDVGEARLFPMGGRAFLLPGYEYNGSPIFLSEFGGIAYIMPGQKVPEEAWGYAGVEPNKEAALARLRGLYEAIARLPAIIGICYTQLTDVEQEINGLMTYDRKPKFEPAEIKALNDLLR